MVSKKTQLIIICVFSAIVFTAGAASSFNEIRFIDSNLNSFINRHFSAPQDSLFLDSLTADLKLKLPKGSRLYIDDKEIEKKEKIENSTDELFLIGAVWLGDHDVKITNLMTDDFNETIHVNKYLLNRDDWASLTLKKEHEQRINKIAREVVSVLIYSAGAGKDFKNVNVPKTYLLSTLKEDYEKLTSAFFDGAKNSGYIFKGITLKYMNSDSTVTFIQDSKVSLTLFIDAEYILSSCSDSSSLTRKNDTLPVTVHLVSTGESWEVCSLKLSGLPFSED